MPLDTCVCTDLQPIVNMQCLCRHVICMSGRSLEGLPDLRWTLTQEQSRGSLSESASPPPWLGNPSPNGIGFPGAAWAPACGNQPPSHALGECSLGAVISTGQLTAMDQTSWQKWAPEAGTGTWDGHTYKTSFSICSPGIKRLVACCWPGSHPCP